MSRFGPDAPAVIDNPRDGCRYRPAKRAVTLAGKATASSGTVNLTVPMPAHQAGDLLIFTYATFGGWASVGPSPAGWSVITKYDGVNEAGVSIYSKVAASSAETATAQPYGAGGGDSAGAVFVFRGAAYKAFTITHAETVAGIATPTLVATGAGRVLHLWSAHKSVSGCNGVPDPVLTDSTNKAYVTKWIGGGTEPYTPGATTARTATHTVAQMWTAAQVLLEAK